MAVALRGAVEITVNGVGQLASARVFLGHAAGNVIKLFPVAGEEDFPCILMTISTAPGKHQFLKFELAPETDLLRVCGRRNVLAADLVEDCFKLVVVQAV